MRYFIFLLLLLCLSCSESRKKGNSTLHFQLEPGSAATASVLNDAVSVLTSRFEKAGFSKNDFEIKSDGKIISVRLSQADTASDNMRYYWRLLTHTAKVRFWETYENADIISALVNVDKQLSFSDGDSSAGSSSDSMALNHPLFAVMQLHADQHQVFPGPVIGTALAVDTAKINQMLSTETSRSLLPFDLQTCWTRKPVTATVNDRQYFELVALKKNIAASAALSEITIVEASVSKRDFGPEISMKMDPATSSRWQRLTKANIGKAIAITLDGMVVSYPTVQGEISGGVSSITGNFTDAEAKEIALILNIKPLPVELRIISQKIE